jgi:hypothetical protein
MQHVRGLVMLCWLLAGCDLLFGPAPGGGVAHDGPVLDGPVGPDGPPADASFDGFSTPVMVTTGLVLTGADFVTDPSLQGDEAWLAFTRTTAGGNNVSDIYLASRVDNVTWTGAVVVPASVATREDTNPELTADGTLMYAAVNQSGDPAELQAWETTGWTDVSAAQAAGLETSNDDRPGTPTPDLQHIVIQRKIGTNPTQLVEYKRDVVNGPWILVPNTLDAVNAIGTATNPDLIAGGRVLVFGGRPTGQTDLDLYVAARASTSEDFSSPTPIPGVNVTDVDDADPWLSADGRRLWFSRVGGILPANEWGIYYTEQP